jgi:transposase InsO family protein
MSGHDQPVAANLLQQAFTAARPNQRWVGDTSELRISENGKAYLAVVLDLFSRFVVGWAISASDDGRRRLLDVWRRYVIDRRGTRLALADSVGHHVHV